MTWVGVGISVVGTGVGLYSQNQAVRKQDKEAASNLIQQGQLRDKANADVQKNITQAKDNPANLARAQEDENAQYAAALQRAKPTGQDAAFTAPAGASSRYASDVNSAIKGNEAFGANQARSMSITDAPGITNLNTQLGLGDTATKIGLIGDQSNQLNALSQQRVASTTANPWLSTLGALMQGGGAAYAGGSLAKKKTSLSDVPGVTGGSMQGGNVADDWSGSVVTP